MVLPSIIKKLLPLIHARTVGNGATPEGFSEGDVLVNRECPMIKRETGTNCYRMVVVWFLFAILVLHPASIFPAGLVGAWLVELGIVPERPAFTTITTVYAPVIWLVDRSPEIESACQSIHDEIEPFAPPR